MIARFSAVWGDPPGRFPVQFLAELRRTMETQSPEVIVRSTDYVIDTRLAWPRPAELRIVALKVAAALGHKTSVPIRKSPESKARVAAMVEQLRATIEPPPAEESPPCTGTVYHLPTARKPSSGNAS
jgi:hypothetical protein